MHKMEELLAATKLKAMLRKAEDQKKSKVCWIVISILAVLAVAPKCPYGSPSRLIRQMMLCQHLSFGLYRCLKSKTLFYTV